MILLCAGEFRASGPEPCGGNNRKWRTFYLTDDNGNLLVEARDHNRIYYDLWVEVIIVFLDATVGVLTTSNNDVQRQSGDSSVGTTYHIKYSSEKPPAFTQDKRIHKHLYSATGNKPWSGPATFPQGYGTILQPHQNEAANNSKRHRWWRDPDGLRFQQIVGVEEYFL